MYVTARVATAPIPHPRWPHDSRARVANPGDLVVTAGNDTRRELAERLRERGNGWWWATMMELFEDHYCNGSFEPFNAADANPFVGLTDTCCVAEALAYPDEGDREIVGRLWFFEEWALQDPLEQLRDRGRTVFRLAGKEEAD
jgi:hypothetical protein